MQRLLPFLFLIIAPFCALRSAEAVTPASTLVSQDEDSFLHTVEPGQTVYALSQMYAVPVEDIYRLNPGSREGIRAGEQLKIPQKSGSYFFHTIRPQETLYSVSRKYQMKGEDILSVNPGMSIETFSAGKIIRIPTNRVTTPMSGSSEEVLRQSTNELLIRTPDPMRLDPIRMALLLPLSDDARMVEYCEGFLLALEEVKRRGISVDVQVYDIGKDASRLSAILEKPEMQTIHLLLGGLTEKQIQRMSDFSRQRAIPYVIPFSSQSDEAMTYPSVYQISTPQSYIYSKAAVAFCDKYREASIVFHSPETAGNRVDFVETLQKELTARKIQYQTIKDKEVSAGDLLPLLSEDKNTVFIPSDDGTEALSKLVIPLRTIVDVHPLMQVSLFGYPAWQVSGAEYLNDLFRFNATFYSVYYANTVSPQFKAFYNRYIHWYSKDLINTYPKFGLLGYDAGMFFIQTLNRYGNAWTANVEQAAYPGIQMDFNFQRINNWGGFINTNLYFVDFDASGDIISHSVKQ
jgi:LysM repeat protein